jgi:antitoxin PrlF
MTQAKLAKKTYTSTLTQKGQVTIPVEIRRLLDLKTSQKVQFEVDGESVKIKPTDDLLSLKGSFPPRPYVKDLDKALKKGFKRKYGKKYKNS